MNFPWTLCIASEDASSLASLRLSGGIEVAEDDAYLWLRGPRGDERLDAKLSGLPARERYEWLPSTQLRPIDRRIPARPMPDLQWQSFDTWFQLEAPLAAMPANPPAVVLLRLVHSTSEREADLLLASLEDLRRFAAMAAQVRLDRLRFAANAAGQVLVRGRPLPSLPSRRFVVHGAVAVPAGFSWRPAVGTDVLNRRFGVSGDALVLWNEDNSITRLLGEQFVPVSRSALRATDQALAEPDESRPATGD